MPISPPYLCLFTFAFCLPMVRQEGVGSKLLGKARVKSRRAEGELR
jgi:hypothetical protein